MRTFNDYHSESKICCVKKLAILFIIFRISINVFSQGDDIAYSGIEYVKVKAEIARGWNTWNTRSILSYVLLPEAISVDFCLKDELTDEVLKEALIGRRGKNAESVLPLGHARMVHILI